MTFEQLVDVVSAAQSTSKAKTREAIAGVFDVIKAQVVDGGEVRIPGFGRFFLVKKGARTVKHPSPNGLVSKDLPPMWRVRFSPGGQLKGKQVS